MKWKHMSERADEIIVNYSQLNQDKKNPKTLKLSLCRLSDVIQVSG